METMMRQLLLAAAFCALAPMALAQTYAPAAPAAPPPMPPQTSMPPGATMSSPMPMASSGGSDNCGTPDEPKPCPPMPRHPMRTYPPNR
jgi:hypothetical protein